MVTIADADRIASETLEMLNALQIKLVSAEAEFGREVVFGDGPDRADIMEVRHDLTEAKRRLDYAYNSLQHIRRIARRAI